MTVSQGTKACYSAAGICLCSGFLLSAATTGILLMMLRDEASINYNYWLTAVMLITFSFAVLTLGIALCGCAVSKHCLCGEADEEEEVDEEAGGADGDAEETGDKEEEGGAEENAGEDGKEEEKEEGGGGGDEGENAAPENEPDEESQKADDDEPPERQGSADSLLPGEAKNKS